MSKPIEALPAHPLGEQSSVECLPEEVGLCADTFGGRVHVEWDPTAAATPFGELPFFVEFLTAVHIILKVNVAMPHMVDKKSRQRQQRADGHIGSVTMLNSSTTASRTCSTR